MKTSCRRIAVILLMGCCTFGQKFALASEWVSVGGNVYFDSIPICALVLINGQTQFSCDGIGRYDMQVPLDENGLITVMVFADGFAPVSWILTPIEAAELQIAILPDEQSPSLQVNITEVHSTENDRYVVSGTIHWGNLPVCALVLANGQHRFSCDENLGQFTLDVPLDSEGNITLMGFADGFKPYRRLITPPYTQSITFVRRASPAIVQEWGQPAHYDFLGWGKAGFYFPQFGASSIVGPKRTDDNMQYHMPRWLEFNFDPFDLADTTFSADKPSCFDNCKGRGVYTRGGYAYWDYFILPNGVSGRSGSLVDEQAENNTNNTVNRITMKEGVPSSFCMHIVTDNTSGAHDSRNLIVVRAGRNGQSEFDLGTPVPELSFNGATDVYTFRFDEFRPNDFIKIRLNSGTPGMSPGLGGLMFDMTCDDIPNA